MRGSFETAKADWDELVRALDKTPGFVEAKTELEQHRPANIDYPEYV